VLDPRNPIQQILFQGHSDQLLDLLGGQAKGLGLNLNIRWLKLWIDIDGGIVQLIQTHSEDPDGCRHHEPRKPQRCTDSPLDHRAPYGR
jgi:hypothetical protein